APTAAAGCLRRCGSGSSNPSPPAARAGWGWGSRWPSGSSTCTAATSAWRTGRAAAPRPGSRSPRNAAPSKVVTQSSEVLRSPTLPSDRRRRLYPLSSLKLRRFRRVGRPAGTRFALQEGQQSEDKEMNENLPAGAGPERGFTLVEGLVATAILLLVAIGIIPLFASSILNNTKG